jgi:hypothetical protein
VRVFVKLVSVLATAALVPVASAQIVCSVTSSMGAAPERDGTITFSFSLESAPHFQFIINAPFSATYQSSRGYVTTNGKIVETARPSERWFRDAAGRERRDYESFYAVHFSDICDPVARVAVLLDPENHVAHRIELEPRDPRVPLRKRSIPRPAGQQQIEDLGEQLIEGVFAQGFRQTTPAIGPDLNEAVSSEEDWNSIDLDLPVLHISKDHLGNTRTTRLTQIVASDPSPQVFQIPKDFRVIDELHAFVISVPKPHAAQQP